MDHVQHATRHVRMATLAVGLCLGTVALAQQGGTAPPAIELPAGNAISNPYRMIENLSLIHI